MSERTLKYNKYTARAIEGRVRPAFRSLRLCLEIPIILTGKALNISRGLEFFTDPNSKKIGGVLEVQTQRRMCAVYECTK